MPPVVDQEFVAHLFAFEDGPQADLAYHQLRSVWTACRDQLGMTAPINRLEVPDRLPRDRRELPPGDDILAAQQRAAVPDRQCVLRRVGGEVLSLSVMMIQPQPQRTGVRRIWANGSHSARLGWADFALLWSQATANGIDALLGKTVLLLARTQTKRNPSTTATAQFGRSLADLLPYDETRVHDWWRHGVTAPNSLRVWDTRGRHVTNTRELVIVAPPDADQRLSRWVWLDPEAVLPSLAEYLLEAAIINYHARVLDDWHAGRRLTDLDSLVTEVAATFGESLPVGKRPELLRAHLNRLQMNEVHLAKLNERLQHMIEQTRYGLRRMAAAWGDPDSLLSNDKALGNWLIDEASSELNYQRTRLASTTHTRQVVADELDRASHTANASGPVADASQAPASPQEDRSRKVFVVHGRDKQVRETFFSFLQALDLRPQDFELLVNATGGTSPNLIDVVRRAPDIAQAIVVLMTPDDTVQLVPDLVGERDPDYEKTVGCQPRPNVLVELGMALMAYPERTIIVEIGSLRPVSDLGGLHVIRFDGSGSAIAKVVSRLRKAGCPVDDSDRTWKDSSRFAKLAAFTREPPHKAE